MDPDFETIPKCASKLVHEAGGKVRLKVVTPGLVTRDPSGTRCQGIKIGAGMPPTLAAQVKPKVGPKVNPTVKAQNVGPKCKPEVAPKVGTTVDAQRISQSAGLTMDTQSSAQNGFQSGCAKWVPKWVPKVVVHRAKNRATNRAKKGIQKQLGL